MKQTLADDPLSSHCSIRQDGRTIHDRYLFQVKSLAESSAPYGLYKLLATIPGEQAFRPMRSGGCPLVAP